MVGTSCPLLSHVLSPHRDAIPYRDATPRGLAARLPLTALVDIDAQLALQLLAVVIDIAVNVGRGCYQY